jgi:hypothetical protein
MVNNSSNINKTKESLNSDGQQFHQYEQNEQSAFILTEFTEHKNMFTNDGQEIHQYQQIKKPHLILTH